MNKKSVFLFACLSMTIISLAMLLPQKKQKVVSANIQTKPKTVNKLNSKKDIKPNQKETMAVSNKIEKQPDILFFLADDMMSIACEPYGSCSVSPHSLAGVQPFPKKCRKLLHRRRLYAIIQFLFLQAA